MANYGDVALKLGADWSRHAYQDTTALSHMDRTVGHEDGVPDAYLTEDMDAEHQFWWIEISSPINKFEQMELNRKRAQGFEFVNKDKWTKNPHLWGWTSDGYCESLAGRLLARSKERYDADEAERAATDSVDGKVRDLKNDLAERAASSGATVKDEDGHVLRKVARR